MINTTRQVIYSIVKLSLDVPICIERHSLQRTAEYALKDRQDLVPRVLELYNTELQCCVLCRYHSSLIEKAISGPKFQTSVYDTFESDPGL